MTFCEWCRIGAIRCVELAIKVHLRKWLLRKKREVGRLRFWRFQSSVSFWLFRSFLPLLHKIDKGGGWQGRYNRVVISLKTLIIVLTLASTVSVWLWWEQVTRAFGCKILYLPPSSDHELSLKTDLHDLLVFVLLDFSADWRLVIEIPTIFS